MQKAENNEDLFHLKRLFGDGIVEDDFQQRINDIRSIAAATLSSNTD
jgi:hypothetical protein